jgi:hypothetical protein
MMELLVLFVFGFVVAAGSFYLGWRQHAKHTDDFLNYILEEITVELVLEKDNGQYFLYKEDDGQFVCQSETIEELAKLFTEQMGSEKIGRVSGNQTFSIVDGKVEYET